MILTFDPLLVSHGDEYRCVAEVDIEDGLSLTNSSALGVIVQSKSLELSLEVREVV